MGSNNIIHGFSASQTSFSSRLRPPPPDDNSLARSTAFPESPIKGKKGQLSILAGGSSDDDEEAESDSEEVSEDLIDDDGSLDWEDSVSERALPCIDEKEIFPMATLQPDIVPRPSLLTAMMYQYPPVSGHPAVAMDARRTEFPPALQQFPIPTNGPSSTTPEDDDDNENTQIMRSIHTPGSKSGAMTSSSSFPVALSPTTIRQNMLADELDESLRGHLHWEHQQKNATANAVFNQQSKAHGLSNLEEYSPGDSAQENRKPGPGNDFVSGPSAGNGQSHENPWNQYFDNETSAYHVKGW